MVQPDGMSAGAGDTGAGWHTPDVTQPAPTQPGMPPVQYAPGTVAPAYPGQPVQYAQPGYPAGYAQPAGYPQGYVAPGYPVAAGPSTPGLAVGSAVVLYVQSAIVLLAGIGIMAVSSLIADIGFGTSVGNTIAALVAVFALLNVLIAVGCIVSGIRLQTGKGRLLLYITGGVNTAYGVFWAVAHVPVVYVLICTICPIVSMILASLTPVSQWLAARRGLVPA